MPAFDPELFMQQNVDQPLETEYKLCPVGEYEAMIGDFTSDAFETFEFEYKKGARAGQQGSMTKFNCPFIISDAKVQKELGRDSTTVTQQIILDIGTDGGLDFGPNKNVALGRIRNAVGQNAAGPWQIAKLRGCGPVMVKITHVKFKRKDGTEGERAEIDRVAPIRGSAAA
jgi:hypothetical protein